MTSTDRYSDIELAEFKAIIEKKRDKAINQLSSLQKQANHIAEKIEEDGDWMDDSSSSGDLELLQTMVHRQKKHIQDLENALLRIRHKNYGICIVTGKLIDKRRLIAVPTTTKSIEGKTAIVTPPIEENPKIIRKVEDETTPKIFSRVIRRTNSPPPIIIEDDFEEENDLEEEEDNTNKEEFDFDSVADSSYDEN